MAIIKICFLSLILLAPFKGIASDDSGRQQLLLSGDQWQVLTEKPAQPLPTIDSPDFAAGSWRAISVPHTFQTRQAFNHPNQAWYRRQVTPPADFSGKRLYLVFEGAATIADVYVNGTHLGQHRGAYTRFVLDATDTLKTGQSNDLAVRVDNDPKDFTDCLPDNSRLYKVWGGLYRKVWLVAVDPLHIDPTDYGSPGVYITPQNISASHADLSVKILVRNTLTTGQNTQIRAILLNPEDIPVETFTTNIMASAGQRTIAEVAGAVKNPRLWAPGKTNLYHVRVELWRGGQLADAVTQPTGFRNLVFDKHGRVSLNGKPIILLGSNLHQEIESKASAMADDDFRTNYAFMQDLGFNFIRLPHYPHAQLEYDLCDRLGIFCWAENGHSNKDHPGPTADQITTEMVKQNYNHPSIAVWSVGNEAGEEVAEREVPVVKALDSTRLVVVANMKCTNADSHGINAYPGWYGGTDVWKFPDHGYVTETGGGGVTSIHCDYQDATSFKFDRYEPEEYQQLLAEARFQECVHDNDGSLGMFAWWCMRDLNDVKYKRPIGWNTKGLITYAGFKKDVYYLYRCFLRPNVPTVHIASQEYFIRTGRVNNGIKAYSNAAHLTLSLDGETVSTLDNGQYSQSNGRHVNNVFYWPVPLHTGKNTISVADDSGHGDSAVIYFYGTNGLPEIPVEHPLLTDLHSSNSNNPAYFMDLPVQAQWPIYYDLDSTADNSFDELPPEISGAKWIALRRVTKPGQETDLSFKLSRPANVLVMTTKRPAPPASLLDAGFQEITPDGLRWRDNNLMLVPAQLFSRHANAGEAIHLSDMDRDEIVMLKE